MSPNQNRKSSKVRAIRMLPFKRRTRISPPTHTQTHTPPPPPLCLARMHNSTHSMTQCLTYALNSRPHGFMTQFNAQVCVWEDDCLPFKFLNYEVFVDNAEKLNFYLIEDKFNLHCKGKLILYRQNGLRGKFGGGEFVKQVAKIVFRNIKLTHLHRECY